MTKIVGLFGLNFLHIIKVGYGARKMKERRLKSGRKSRWIA